MKTKFTTYTVAAVIAGTLLLTAAKCEPPDTGQPVSERDSSQHDLREGEYEVTCGDGGRVLSYLPRTKWGYRNARMQCQQIEEDLDIIQKETGLR